MKFIAETLRVH